MGRTLSPIFPGWETATGEALRPRRRSKLIAFGWYGGKFNHLDWLLPLLPACHHYCEPFAGSAAILLNRQPSPVETYNDIDGEVVNFFRVLRDQKNKPEKRGNHEVQGASFRHRASRAGIGSSIARRRSLQTGCQRPEPIPAI